MLHSTQTLTPKRKELYERDLISAIHFLNRDVVIPKNGGGREISHTDGFRRYTKLVNESIEGYKTQRSSGKRQFVVDKIIAPLINEGRNFYRYDRQKRCYKLVDLSDDIKILSFTKNVVMQKIRDIVKQNDSHSTKRKNASQPCPSNMAVPKRDRKKIKNQTQEQVDSFFGNDDSMCPFMPLPDAEANHVLETDVFEDIESNNADEEDEKLMHFIGKLFPERERITSQFNPLLNILLTHPDVKYLSGATNEINLMVVKAKLENKCYDSIAAVERDLCDIFSNQSEDVEGISKNFLTLVTNYCRGIDPLFS